MTRAVAFAAVVFFAANAQAHHCALEETMVTEMTPFEHYELPLSGQTSQTVVIPPTDGSYWNVKVEPCAKCSGGNTAIYHNGPCPYDLLRVCPKCGYALPHELKWR